MMSWGVVSLADLVYFVLQIVDPNAIFVWVILVLVLGAKNLQIEYRFRKRWENYSPNSLVESID